MSQLSHVSKTLKAGNATLEKRKGQLAVPLNLKNLLSQEQIGSVQQMEHFGWHLAFVRRDNKNKPVVVVKNGSEQSFALLEHDGSINTSAQLAVR
ncbi:MAG: hypothetical protein K6L76_08250 [Agarilytica sp.]